MWIMRIVAVLAIAFATPSLALAQQVRVEGGRVAGVTENGVASWKGIPFAAPPVGDLRWRAPQKAARWSGVREAGQYGADCMQLPFPSYAAPLGVTPAEDCLYVNVWKPANATGKLPVMVWIYGGGFVNGGSSPATYTGANIAPQGVVFVSFNYRLGRFGTFAHPQLTKAAADGKFLGNYGYMDQLAALKWIKRNVAAFGGDPSNITLMGESAGGMSVHALLTSPLTKGLFHRAVIMSGSDGGGMGAGSQAVEEIGLRFAQTKGIAPDDPQALAKLRALPPEQIVDGLNLGQRGEGPPTNAAPYADGYLAVPAAAAYARGAFPKVQVMIGATSADIGGKTGRMIAGGRRLSGVIAEQGAPVYAYRFSYVAQSLTRDGAGHASDIPYFLDTAAIKYGAQATPRDVTMGHTIARYLANFARTGNPNGEGLPAWPRYDRTTDQIMDFAASGEAVPQKDPWGPELDAATPPAAP